MKARTGTKKELKSIMELPALLFVSCYNASKEADRIAGEADSDDVLDNSEFTKAYAKYEAYMDLIKSAKLEALYNQFLKTM